MSHIISSRKDLKSPSAMVGNVSLFCVSPDSLLLIFVNCPSSYSSTLVLHFHKVLDPYKGPNSKRNGKKWSGRDMLIFVPSMG